PAVRLARDVAAAHGAVGAGAVEPVLHDLLAIGAELHGLAEEVPAVTLGLELGSDRVELCHAGVVPVEACLTGGDDGLGLICGVVDEHARGEWSGVVSDAQGA